MPSPIYYSINEFDGDGVTTERDFNFAGGYIDRAHVKALVRDEFGAPTDIPITSGSFVSAFRLTLPITPVGHTLRIYRETPREEPLVNFTGGSNFTEANLDVLARQVVMCAAEAFDAGAYAGANDLLGAAQTAASQAASALAAALSAQSTASAAAVSATASDATATTQAGISTTQANLAASDRALALGYRNEASTFRNLAVDAWNGAITQEALANIHASSAAGSASSASSSATSASTSATTATAQAAAALASANAADADRIAAAASAAAAATFDPANFTGRTGGATGAADIPAGTTAQRPGGVIGRTRWNSTLNGPETYDGVQWVPGVWQDFGQVATASGTGGQWVALPSYLNELRLVFSIVSQTAAANSRVRLGTSGGMVTAGYSGVREYVNMASATTGGAHTDGFHVPGGASVLMSGIIHFQRVGTTWWVSGVLGDHGALGVGIVGGRVDLGAVLTQLEIVTTAGAYDGGFVQLLGRP